jgi:hypothetical protein
MFNSVHLNEFVSALDTNSHDVNNANCIIAKNNDMRKLFLYVWLDDNESPLILAKRMLKYNKKIRQSANKYIYMFTDKTELDFELIIQDSNVIEFNYLCFVNGQWIWRPVYPQGDLTKLKYSF